MSQHKDPRAHAAAVSLRGGGQDLLTYSAKLDVNSPLRWWELKGLSCETAFFFSALGYGLVMSERLLQPLVILHVSFYQCIKCKWTARPDFGDSRITLFSDSCVSVSCSGNKTEVPSHPCDSGQKSQSEPQTQK